MGNNFKLASDCVSDVLSDVELSERASFLANDIAQKASLSKAVSGCVPESVAGGAVYAAHLVAGGGWDFKLGENPLPWVHERQPSGAFPPTQQDVASAAGVTPPAIRSQARTVANVYLQSFSTDGVPLSQDEHHRLERLAGAADV